MSRNHSRTYLLRPLAGLLAVGLSVPALAQSTEFPTYVPGAADERQLHRRTANHRPRRYRVNLGNTTRAKAIALNPTGNNTAAVLQMGAPQVVTVFNTTTGAVLQTFKPTIGAGGSSTGITYTPDGKYLLFSQDGDYGPSYFAVASVSASGMLTNFANVAVPIAVDSTGKFTNVTCFGVDYTKVQQRLQPEASVLREPQAASIFPAATPFRSSPIRRLPPIPWASRSRRMPRPHT